MQKSLQSRLTLSHLAVTAVSVIILVILILIGYFFYLRSDLAATWAGDIAENYATELAFWATEEGNHLDATLAQEYVDTAGYDLGVSVATEAEFAEWLLIIDSDNKILAGNFLDQYQAGDRVGNNLAGFNPAANPKERHFDTVGDNSVGQAPIRADNGELLGWVYYRFPNDSWFQLTDTARSVVLAAVGAGFIAIVVSGVMGGWLAGYFGRRLNTLSQASAAFAAGNLEQRIVLDGTDEISQLGNQFNQMADQISQQIQDLRLLAEKNARLAEEARALAALEERNRLARELHDAIKQQLFGLGLMVGSAQQLIEKEPQKATARLTKLTGMVAQVQEEMDGIIKQLRPASLNDRGLAEGLREFCEGWREQTAVSLQLTIQKARQLPLNIEHALYRVAQESLNNVARHARATQVEVQLGYEETAVYLHITDNGIGFRPGDVSNASFGLINMKERVTKLGGDLKIESSVGGGTAVHAHVPIL